MSADAGADQRAMAALQATVKDLSARLVALEAKVDALESDRPSHEGGKRTALHNPDQDRLSDADKEAMRKGLRESTNAAALANAEKHRNLAADREAESSVE